MLTPPLPMIVFLSAVLWTLLFRMITPSSRGSIQAHPRTACSIKILFRVCSKTDWNSIIWDHISAAAYPEQIRFGVLVECESMHDAESEVDALLRGSTSVEYTVAKGAQSIHRNVHRLCRRFIVGDETIVVVVDWRARFQMSFDAHLIELGKQMDDSTLVSSPSRCTDDKGHFPCSLRRANRKRRNGSLPFRNGGLILEPSVCVCTEMMFARPRVLQIWSSARDEAVRHVSTPCPLMVDDMDLEQEHIDTDQDVFSSKSSEMQRYENVGIGHPGDRRELVHKFGSVRSGRLAVKFGYEELSAK